MPPSQPSLGLLDITVLRGSGQAVLDWASENGFAVDAETRAHVLQYAKGSPVFGGEVQRGAGAAAAAARSRAALKELWRRLPAMPRMVMVSVIV